MGDALAASPIVTHPEMVSLDNQLVDWYNSLPPLLKDHEPSSDAVSTTRTVMRWRYQSQRILLHRPVLLSYAMRRIPYVALRAEERYAIERCRMVADETVRDVAATMRLNQKTGWNAVWLLFQATLVPLLGLFIADNTATHAHATLDSCRNQVETAMAALQRLEPWSPTAKRTLEVVSRILEASQRARNTTASSYTTASGSQARTPSISSQSIAHSTGSASTAPLIHTNTTTTTMSPPIPTLGNNNNNNNTGFEGYQNVAPYMEQSPQQMLDYITWSDGSIWPGVQEGYYQPQHHQAPTPVAVAVFGQGEEYLKPLEHGSVVAGGGRGPIQYSASGYVAPDGARYQ